MLDIRFLGEPRFLLDGKDISGAVSVKCALLLALLLTQRDRKMRRQELLGLLWPQSSEDAARYNLRYNLWQLKRALGDGEPLVVTSKNNCWINDSFPFTCDLTTVLETDIAATEDENRLERLLALMEGDFFESIYFEDCEDLDEFIMARRYELECRKIALLKHLAVCYDRRGNWEQCLRIIDLSERMDPYDEDTAAIRLRILRRQGRYQEAQDYYRRFCMQLFSEVGAEPGPALRQLGGRTEEVADRPRQLHIVCQGIPTVPFYAMADFLKRLKQAEGFRMEDYLSSSEMTELAYIQREFGDPPPQPPSPPRLVDTFMALVERILADGRSITVDLRAKTADEPSKSVFMELTTRHEKEPSSFRLKLL